VTLRSRLTLVVVLGAVYLALALIATFPLILKFTEAVPGGGDVWQFINQFWWFKKALIEQKVNPYFDPYMFYPTGVSLASTTLTPFNTLLSVPLQFIFNLPTTYNILFLLTFVMTGYGTFALARYLIEDRWAAFGSSIIFTFCSYRLMRGLGHLNLLTTQFIPLYTLFLIRTLRTRKTSDALLAGLFLALVGLSSEIYLVQVAVLSLILSPIVLWWTKERSLKGLVRPLLLGLGAFLVIALPFYYSTASLVYFGDVNLGLPLSYVSMNSVDLLAYFTPNLGTVLYDLLFSGVYSHFTASPLEATVFIGYTTIALATFASIRQRSKETHLWAAMAVVFAGLSLGPELHLYGVSIFDLPYKIAIFPLAPFYIPSRFSLTCLLSFSMLAGYGFRRLMVDRRIRSRNLIGIALCVLILVESLIIPYPVTAATAPSIYYQMRADREPYAIMEVPLSPFPVHIARYLYYQTIHEKPIVGGWVSRLPQSTLRSFEQNPLVAALVAIHSGRQVNASDVARGLQMLRENNVRYIIVHRALFLPNELQQIEDIFGQLPKQIADDANDPLIIYRL
jgi:hypothetical protein